MLIVGLSGGIATGKSTCSAAFVREGIHVIDCDAIAKDVVKPGRWGWKRIKDAFEGHDIFNSDGSLDRDKLGSLIFSDSALRARLNKATHLPIFAELARCLALSWLRCHQVVDMPLLFETGGYRYTSNNTLAVCSQEVQLRRLCQRDGIDERTARAKIDAQTPLAEKTSLADHIIDNDGDQKATELQVQRLAEKLRKSSRWHLALSPPGIGLAVIVLKAVF